MEQRFQQTLNFNFNDVPVRFNLSSTEPLPENFVVDTVRSLVRNASTAIGYNTNEQNSRGSVETAEGLPTSSLPVQLPVTDPNSTAIPMWSQETPSLNQTTQPSSRDNLNEPSDLPPPPIPPQSLSEQASLGENGEQPNTRNARALSTSEIVTALLPHLITASRIILVLYGKRLSGYFLDLILCISLIIGYFRADEVIKRVAYSEQLLSWRNMKGVVSNLFFVSTGLLLTAWLYSHSGVFSLFIFNLHSESWVFGNFIITATTVIMINYFIKNCVAAIKLMSCLITRFAASCLPLLPNFMSFADIVGHLYTCAVVISFWYVYIMRSDGSYTIGIIIFMAYITSRVPFFVGLFKNCLNVSVKLMSCRTFGRRATSKEVDQAAQCAICLQNGFRAPTVVSCSHVFCHNCISRWLLENRSCPVCRENLITNSENFQVTSGIFFM